MKVRIFESSQEATHEAAALFIEQIQRKPDCVLGLATGSTPIKLYKELIQAYKAGTISFKRVKTFNLDEYVGLDRLHTQSYYRFMCEQLFDHVDIDKRNCHVPNGQAKDIEREVMQYEAAIEAAGGIDMQLLGIGGNGHIGFNEPGCNLDCGTHLESLTRQTIQDNARLFFNGNEAQVPRQALTMGVGTILRARRCVLLAFGKSKQVAVQGMIEGPITKNNPASVLQRHPDTVVLLDTLAAEKLKKKV